MPFPAPWRLLAPLCCTLACAQTPAPVTLQYEVEWRLIRAGTARFTLNGTSDSRLHLLSTGLVATLFKVNDTLSTNYGPGFCLQSSNFEVHEGRRHREAKTTVDAAARRIHYLERDVVKNATVNTKELEHAGCVYDVTGGLALLRERGLAPRQTWEPVITDGRKVAPVRIEAQGKETVKTSLGTFTATKYEVGLMNGVIYSRKGRIFVWMSDDARRLPVRIRVQMPFYAGTVDLNLEKEERP